MVPRLGGEKGLRGFQPYGRSAEWHAKVDGSHISDCEYLKRKWSELKGASFILCSKVSLWAVCPSVC